MHVLLRRRKHRIGTYVSKACAAESNQIALLASSHSSMASIKFGCSLSQANFYRTTRLDPPQSEPLISSLDPLFDAVACRFDLRDGVMHLYGEGSTPYWSMSVHDRAGLSVFSVNDDSSLQGKLDFVVATPAQMIALRNAMPQELSSAVFVEADIVEGIAVVRTFVPDPSFEPSITAWLSGINCTAY